MTIKNLLIVISIILGLYLILSFRDYNFKLDTINLLDKILSPIWTTESNE